MKKPAKIRIDNLLVDRGLAPSRQRAQAMILAGQVLAGEQRVEKPSQNFDPGVELRLKVPDHPYVGRGGVKLKAALEYFNIDPKEKTCLDVGASTGGFTDCLLQAGARRVYTLDSGTNQLHYRLRQDPRVVCRENFNVRQIQPGDVPEPVQLAVVDVSFISLKLVLPPLLGALSGALDLLMLVKPQFEAPRGSVSRGGVLRDAELGRRTVEEIASFAGSCGLRVRGIEPAVLKGEQGNQEYFLFAQR